MWIEANTFGSVCCAVRYSKYWHRMCSDFLLALSLLSFNRILALEKLGAVFNQQAIPLQYTPRQFVIDSVSNNIVVIESDHNALTEQTKQERKQQMAEEMLEAAGEDEREAAAQMAEEFLGEDLPDSEFTAAKPGTSHWASVVRMVNPIEVQCYNNTEVWVVSVHLYVFLWTFSGILIVSHAKMACNNSFLVIVRAFHLSVPLSLLRITKLYVHLFPPLPGYYSAAVCSQAE